MGSFGDRDPETLLGPLLGLLTRLARHGGGAERASELQLALAAHAAALAAHPRVPLELRLAAGALAIEHRQRPPCLHRAVSSIASASSA